MKQRKQSIFGELHVTVHISQASELLDIPAHELNKYFVDCKVLSLRCLLKRICGSNLCITWDHSIKKERLSEEEIRAIQNTEYKDNSVKRAEVHVMKRQSVADHFIHAEPVSIEEWQKDADIAFGSAEFPTGLQSLSIWSPSTWSASGSIGRNMNDGR